MYLNISASSHKNLELHAKISSSTSLKAVQLYSLYIADMNDPDRDLLPGVSPPLKVLGFGHCLYWLPYRLGFVNELSILFYSTHGILFWTFLKPWRFFAGFCAIFYGERP